MKIEIEGLPEQVSHFLTGRVYVVVSNEHALIKKIVSDSLQGQSAAGLISSKKAIEYLTPEAHDAWKNQKLSFLNLDISGLKPSVKRSERILNELNFFNFNKKSVLIIDPAEGLINLSNAQDTHQQLDLYKQWAINNDCALVWIFSSLVTQPDSLNNLIASADQFAGIVRVIRENEQSVWKVLHWFSHKGMQGQQNYELLMLPHANKVQVKELKKESSVVPLSLTGLDDDLIYITQKAAFDARDLPHLWSMFESLEQLLKATQDVVNATIVLDYSETTQFNALAKHVYNLRHQLGNHFKLVVRENGASVRHYHEQLLLRLGCNLVVPNSIKFSRFVSLLNTLQGQIFIRQLDDSFERILRDVPPSHDIGYLYVPDFITSVQKTLQGMHISGVHSVLICLDFMPHVSALDVLNACHLKRIGDVFCSNEHSLFVFLFACRESDISSSLEGIIALPIQDLFVEQQRYVDLQDIENKIQMLEKSYQNDPAQFIDYSDLLQERDLDVQNQTMIEANDSRSTRHLIFTANQPNLALANPLKLRAKLDA